MIEDGLIRKVMIHDFLAGCLDLRVLGNRSIEEIPLQQDLHYLQDTGRGVMILFHNTLYFSLRLIRGVTTSVWRRSAGNRYRRRRVPDPSSGTCRPSASGQGRDEPCTSCWSVYPVPAYLYLLPGSDGRFLVNDTRKCGALCLSAQEFRKNLVIDKAALHHHTTRRKVYMNIHPHKVWKFS